MNDASLTKKIKYQIGENKFTSKNACYLFTKNIISKNGFGIINETNKDFPYFISLINNHSESELKIGVGIKYFIIESNPWNKSVFQTAIQRTDGSRETFSWKHCCEFKQRTNKQLLIQAMRQAVSEKTIDFKRKNKHNLICNICKTKDEKYSNYHVDHDEPSFKILSDDFLKHTKIECPTTFIHTPIFNTPMFNECSDDFRDEWVNYHNSNCKLQILCASCNLRKIKN